MTALILRYEHSIHESTEAPQTTNLAPPPIATLATKELSAASTHEWTIAPREPVPQDHLRFQKPLFYTLLLATACVHIPAILLSLPFATWMRASKDVPLWLRVTAQVVLMVPAQFWTLIVLPPIVFIACKVRSDGDALWRYSEMLFRLIDEAVEPGAAEAAESPLFDAKLVDEA